MRATLKLYSMFVVILIVSCTPPITFETAYPQNGKDLNIIPEIYQGNFICESDSALLIISDNLVIKREEHYFLAPMSVLKENENCTVINNELYIEHKGICVPLEQVKENIVRGHYIEVDTLFVMNKDSRVRIHKGHLVLSNEIKNASWAISLLSLEDNYDLTYKALTSRSDLDQLSEITPMSEVGKDRHDKPIYKINPTLIEFDQMIENEAIFIECEYLKRIHTIIL